MGTGYWSLLSEQRKCIVYVPWISILSLVIVLTGTIVWGVGTSNALKNTDNMFRSLRIDLDSEIKNARIIASFTIAACCTLAAGMVAMSIGRSLTEHAVDQKGTPTRGSVYWLAASAVATLLWWLLLVLLMFVFFMCVLWLGLAAAVTLLMEVAVDTADNFVSWGIHYQNTTNAILEAQLGPLPDYISSSCPSNCYNFVLMEYITESMVCICGPGVLLEAYWYAMDVLNSTVAVVVGCFLVWVGSSFLLMNSTADFAQARRERALLLRVQRTLAAGGSELSGPAGRPNQQPLPPPPPPAGLPAGPVIELASSATAYGTQPAYGDGGGYADVDKEPLLKAAQKAHQQSYGQPPQQAFGQPYRYPDQPVVIAVAEQSDAAGRQASVQLANGR